MGDGIGIPAGNGIEQQQLQDLELIKIIQPLLQKPPPGRARGLYKEKNRI